MASSSSSHPRNNKYDVFLSFKGEDTRDNFTSHLYSALSQKGIETFIDNDLKRGDEISQSLVDAIEASSISIIIFSESYASSSWCLDELLRILECKTNYGQIVIPVFYRVDPSHVRKQSGNFEDSFSKLEEQFPDRMQTWRIALTEAANLSGFDSHVIRPESHLIEEIANEVLERLDDTFQSESKDLVGVESRIKEIEALLGTGSTDVYKLGIWGIGGIGKTTIAGAIFNKISRHFEGSYFAHNVRDADQTGRLPHLRQELLSALLGGENVKNIPNTGLNFQSKRLTSRKVKELGGVDALKLFSRFAFGRDHLDASYLEPTKEIVKYAQGVPLLINQINGENKCKISDFQGPGFAELRYLHWHGYPLKSLLSNIHLEKLVLLEMPHSNIQQPWKSVQHFDLSGNFKLDRKEVRGIFEDALQDIQLMAAARWKQVREEGYFLEKCGYVIFPGNEIPKWFKFQSVGSSSSITLEMPTPLPGCFSNKNRVLGFTFSAIVAFGEHRVDYCDGWFEFFCDLQVKSKECQSHHVLERCDIALIRYVESDHLVLGYYLFGDEDLNGFREYNCVMEAMAVQFYFQHLASSHSLERCGVKVKKCGFHLLSAPDSTEKEQYAAQTIEILRLESYLKPSTFHRDIVNVETEAMDWSLQIARDWFQLAPHVVHLGKAQGRMLRLVLTDLNQAFYLGKVQGRMPRFIPTDPNLVHHVAQLGKAQARMLKLVPIESNQAPHAVHLGKALGRMLRLVPTSLN
ncbi:Disease resistance-like protein DSC1 [Citrus sinensis]|uniref:Disease resistance-like protein DSC1 n=1 Tax=Citrus sinensis TaxID=2711 RepID=A0ACB8M8D5_CITSI|nr:Disease resistance-like protein DSC1 [Citrus sinensis]